MGLYLNSGEDCLIIKPRYLFSSCAVFWGMLESEYHLRSLFLLFLVIFLFIIVCVETVKG